VPVVVQLDEPSLPAALAGRLTGVTSFSSVHPVDEAVAQGLFDGLVERVGGEVALHCCAADLPWKLLQRTALTAISVDVATLSAADLDGIGEFVESGRVVMLGVIPVQAPDRPTSPREVAKVAASITDRLGFSREVLRDRTGVTPACGLAGATGEWARTAIELAQKVADGIAQDPSAA
jgi:methionine synthase II (cobalamin-independent)